MFFVVRRIDLLSRLAAGLKHDMLLQARVSDEEASSSDEEVSSCCLVTRSSSALLANIL